jgi:ammonia channel protein AmtB
MCTINVPPSVIPSWRAAAAATAAAAAAAAAGFVNTGAAFLIGVIGSVVCSGAQALMERYGKKYITDTCEVFVCHGVSE